MRANAGQAMSQENVEIVRRSQEAFARGDLRGSIGATSRPKRNNTDFGQAQDSATQSAVIAARNWRP